MKIAFIVGEFPAISQTFILNQITGLLDKGHDVTIFAKCFSRNSEVHGDVIKYDLLSKVNYFIDFPENKFKRILNGIYLFIRGILKNPTITLNSLNVFKYKQDASSLKLLYLVTPFLGRRFDILQCHFGNIGIIGAKLKQLGVKGKLVTMFHGNDIRAGLKEGSGIYKELADKGDCFLAISDYNYKNLIKFGVDGKKIIYHPVGINLNMFKFKEEQDFKKGKNSVTVIITVARLVKEKGLEYGIRAISKLLEIKPKINLKYYVVGSGSLEKELKKIIIDLNLETVVELLGEMQQEKVIKKMEESDIFLLPSIDEALPVVLMEAQAIGLPVIATFVGSVDQVVLNEKSGFLVPVGDTNSMAERIGYLINNPKVCLEMGRIGRQFVEEKYDIRKLNAKLIRVYEGLIKIG